MGLALPSLRYLVHEHKKAHFGKKVLILGRQYVFATFDEVLELLKLEDIEPARLDPDFDTTTNIPKWKDHPDRKKHTSDTAFFALLGLKLYAMDISDYEGAEYVHDLNDPIPDELNEMFDLVIDGGTMEHLFNTKQCLENIVRMTKIGGRIIHMSPSNNYPAHGLYQLSPDLFYDYYTANNFDNLDGLYVVTPMKTMLSKIYGNTRLGLWETFELNQNYYGKMFVSKHPAAILFTAQKTRQSTFHKIPQQGDYFRKYKNKLDSKLGETTGGNARKTIGDFIPQTLKPFIKLVLYPIYIRILNYKKVRMLYKKPWGLKFKGKL